jgi:hypothetical protein
MKEKINQLIAELESASKYFNVVIDINDLTNKFNYPENFSLQGPFLSGAVSDIAEKAKHLIQFINRPDEVFINLDGYNSTIDTCLEFLNQLKALGGTASDNLDNSINGKIGVSFSNNKLININIVVDEIISDIIKSAQTVQKLGAKLKE